MKLSNKGKEFLIKEEGIVLKPYKDQVGVWTIGVGSTYWEDGRKVSSSDKPITRERAMSLMDTTLKQYEQAVNTAIKVPLNQNQYDALVSLCYNIGTGGFKGSSLVKQINNMASEESITRMFEMWSKAGGEPILLARRKREAKLYHTPISSVEVKQTTTDVNLRLGAGTSHKVLSVLPKGTEVNILNTEGSWSHVFVCGSRLTGFVSSTYLL